MTDQRELRRKRGSMRWILAGGLGASVVVCAVAFFVHQDAGARRHRPPELPVPKAYQPLAAKLIALDSALDKKPGALELEGFANDLQSELRRHPLPDNDDLRFEADLVVRYLRRLAPLDSYRRLKLARQGYDPLDPNGPHPDARDIATWRHSQTSLRARIKDLLAMLQSLKEPSPAAPP